MIRTRVTILILLLAGCKEPVELKTDGGLGIVVIDGKINTQPGPYTLNIGFTVGDYQRPTAFENAHAILIDETEGFTEEYLETEPGIYSTSKLIQGKPGHTYHVQVQLADGREYWSKSETIPDATGVDDSYYKVGRRSDFVGDTEVLINTVEVYVDTQLPPKKEKPYYFRWDVDEYYVFEQTPRPDPMNHGLPPPCYVYAYSDPQRITTFSTRDKDVSVLKNQLVSVQDVQQTFLTRKEYTVYCTSLTKESYEYWNVVNQQINKTGSIFDTPPAPVKGNLYSMSDQGEAVYGHFEAGNASFSRITIFRADLDVVIPPYCNDASRGVYWPDYPQECSACLMLPHSSSTPPPWWPR